MTVESIKHKKDKRALIPSSEEAGAESESPLAQQTVAEIPVNPVVTRGQDPELFWMHKYGAEDRDDLLRIDIRSLYRHEHVAPETLIGRLHSVTEAGDQQPSLFDLFGEALEMDELDKVCSYYQYQDEWQNRLIQGDSLLVMTSLLEREGMAGKVQCIYIDPPYGIKYGSNWQMKLNNRTVKDGDDADLTGEPEQIKAYRDTWELGIHSYLSYLRERLLVARDLLTESGSCFVQISDENLHLLRCVMDEVFGSSNFRSVISVKTTSAQTTDDISNVCDYLVWYFKDREVSKKRKLLLLRGDDMLDRQFDYVELADGTLSKVGQALKAGMDTGRLRRVKLDSLTSEHESRTRSVPFEYEGRAFLPQKGRQWATSVDGLVHAGTLGRLHVKGENLFWKRYADEFAYVPLDNLWTDTAATGTRKSDADEKQYVVQTMTKVIQRCILMTTDPGDLVLDPTCGSGTTAYVAEQWGRRWITIDTSRIALNIAKQRLTTATFPYYRLHDPDGQDIRQGFVYKKVPHVTLKSIANDEPPAEETLYDQPEIDSRKMRVSGPFTVETLQNFEPAPPEALDEPIPGTDELEQFEERVFEHLKSAGVKNGRKNECAIFTRVEHLSDGYLHAEGFYPSAAGERKAYFHIGPKFGTVSKLAVNEAVKACRARGDADWLILLGFSFESDIQSESVTTRLGSFEVTRARMHDDLMQDGLLKRDKKAASFVTIGEPDIRLDREGDSATVEICGLDIYDPIKDEVKARDLADIAYWMVDDDYDGTNFIVRQVFFCGGDRDEFDKWKKGLSDLAVSHARRKAERTLRVEIDEDAFTRLYGYQSHPIPLGRPGQKIAVRVISQFGEESTKVLVG